jgi:hypothetical protein
LTIYYEFVKIEKGILKISFRSIFGTKVDGYRRFKWLAVTIWKSKHYRRYIGSQYFKIQNLSSFLSVKVCFNFFIVDSLSWSSRLQMSNNKYHLTKKSSRSHIFLRPAALSELVNTEIMEKDSKYLEYF